MDVENDDHWYLQVKDREFNLQICVKFEAFTEVKIKNAFSMNVILCILVGRYQSVKEAYCLQYQCINSKRRHRVPTKHLYLSTILHGVTSQKTSIMQTQYEKTVDT